MTSTAEVSTQVDLPAQGDWGLDPAHTVAGLVGRYLMVTKVPGKFTDVAGTIHIAERPEDSWVEVSLDTAGITTDHKDRDNHLKSADFLDVANYPSIEFRSTRVQGARAHWTVEGDLTIKGQTRPVTLDLEYHGAVGDPWGGQRSAFTATTQINREDWGADLERRSGSRGRVGGPQSHHRNRDPGRPSDRPSMTAAASPSIARKG